MARVLLFGPLQDLAGWRERQLAAATLGELRALIAGQHAALGEALTAPGCRWRSTRRSCARMRRRPLPPKSPSCLR